MRTYLINGFFQVEAKNQAAAWKEYENEHSMRAVNTIVCLRKKSK